jgi:hypothetical protein
MSELLVFGTITQNKHELLAVKVLEKTWVMHTCSPLSGQMAFRVWDSEWKKLETEGLKAWLREDSRHPQVPGVTTDGWIEWEHRTVPYDTFVAKSGVANDLLHLRVDGKQPFLSVDGAYPFYTDGRRGFRVEWQDTQLGLKLPSKPEHKSLRLIVDPVRLDCAGKILIPLTEVIERIRNEDDVFADPFAERNVGKKEISFIKQISPGMRQRARKISRKS